MWYKLSHSSDTHMYIIMSQGKCCCLSNLFSEQKGVLQYLPQCLCGLAFSVTTCSPIFQLLPTYFQMLPTLPFNNVSIFMGKWRIMVCFSRKCSFLFHLSDIHTLPPLLLWILLKVPGNCDIIVYYRRGHSTQHSWNCMLREGGREEREWVCINVGYRDIWVVLGRCVYIMQQSLEWQ